MFVGLITGFVNGLFGSGGGMILVPAMQKFYHTEVHKSHATAIAIILPISILSTVIYFRYSMVDFKTVIEVCIGGLAGGYLGANLLNKISSDKLHKVFGLIMIISAFRMIL